MSNAQIDLSFIDRIKDKVALSSGDTVKTYIPDIIEFCNSKRYLNLLNLDRSESPVTLYPMQQIILKCFYRGQPGNEDLKLTKEELELLFENNMHAVLDKYHSDALFRELVLVLGRRSGKDFITSIIALYECMRLLECPGGSPISYYNIAPGNPLYVITIATSSDQAKLLFNDIKAKIQNSEYFRHKIAKTEADKIWLLTPEDRRNTRELEGSGIEIANPGSVCIMSGHSNSESLLGKRIFCLLLDEVASFKTTGGASSGDQIYKNLAPCTADFGRPGKLTYLDPEDGEPKRILDSKIISISSPRAKEGILYRLYCDTAAAYTRLSFKLPTWKVNLSQEEKNLRSEFKFMTPADFDMEFGAEFSGTGGERFIPDIYIDNAQRLGMELGLSQKIVGIPGMVYYAHLDPATSSHNYALVVIHSEDRIRFRQNDHGVSQKETAKLFIVDHIKVWTPTKDRIINPNEVDSYVIDLAKRFRLASVTYDSWNCDSSILKLRSKGISARMTAFRKSYKIRIYDFLEQLLINNQIALPFKGIEAQLMASELKNLKRIYGPQGYRITVDEEGTVSTDDTCDALAGALGEAMNSTYKGYPKSSVVFMPQYKDDNSKWEIGRGQYSPSQWQYINKTFLKH